VYTFNAELYEHPNPDGPKTIGGFDTETALKGKPVLSTSKSIFNVGDVDAETQPAGQSTNDGIVKAVQFKHGNDAPWRTKTKQAHDGDGYIVAINMDHPEYKAFKELHTGYTISDIQRDLCTKWGFFRIHFGQAKNEIDDILREHNIQNSQVTSEMKNTIQEYIENYDEFRKEFVTESPITGELDIND
jgi:hypothetical protein